MKKTFSVFGIIVGIIIIILGFKILDVYLGFFSIESTSFGGDFYTYSYKATRLAAENTRQIAELVQMGFGYLLIAIGATDICLFGCKLADTKQQSIPTVVENSVSVEAEVSEQE